MNKKTDLDFTREPLRDLLKLILYWSVALIPLGWGMMMTIVKAMALFN